MFLYRPRNRIAAAALTVTAVALLACTAAMPASASPISTAPPPASDKVSSAPLPLADPAVDPRAAKFLATDRGISVADATKELRGQDALQRRGQDIAAGLGEKTGGTYLDARGRLVVTTTDTDADTKVRSAGARPVRVARSLAALQQAQSRLQTAGESASAVQEVHLDPVSNQVVATVTTGAKDTATTSFLATASSLGSSVRIIRAPAAAAPRPAEYLVGGYGFNTPQGTGCSIGFNAVDSSNRNVVVTAGHCVGTSGNISRNGYIIGKTRTANFPGTDYGTFYNSYPSYWIPSPSIYNYSNKTYIRVPGASPTPAVGTVVCKSGITTGYTCGYVRALNSSVHYAEGWVYHLVQHDACVEPGDSGGSNITSSGYALGLTSGASTPTTGTYKGKCLSKTGQQNQSWYQPIGPALSANGLRLVN